MFNIIDNTKYGNYNSSFYTPKDLLHLFEGEVGCWVVFSAPARDERGGTHPLCCYEGKFEDVLTAAKKLHGFLDDGMCGKIAPLKINKL